MFVMVWCMRLLQSFKENGDGLLNLGSYATGYWTTNCPITPF